MAEEPDEAQAKRRDAMDVHLTAVGRVAAIWANFELLIDVYALALAQIDRIGHCFTAQIAGSARKLDAYIAVARHRGAAKFSGELDKFAKDTASLAERRNRIVHDPWLRFDNEHPRRFEVTARRALRYLHVTVPTVEVVKLARDITAHRERFTILHDGIVTAIAA